MAELVPIRVSELPEASSVSDTDVLIIDNGEQTQKIPVGTFNEEAAESAKHYADEAALSATNASASATAANTSANNASSSATAAAGSATAAAGSAGAAATSAQNAADSATDAEQAATAATEAVEEMENISDNLVSDFSDANDYAVGDYVRYNGKIYKFTAAHAAGIWIGTDATEVILADDLGSEVTDLKSAIGAALVTETASGTVLAIDDGADGIDSKGYTLTIEPHQSGSGDPSPDNVRPISGYTSVKTVRAWGNIIDNTPLPVTLSGSNFVNLALPPGTLQRLIESNVPVTLHIDGVLGEDKTQYVIYAPSESNNSPILIGGGFVLSESNNFTRSGTMQIQGAPASYTYADILRIYVQPYAGSATSTIHSVQFCVGDTVIAESGALTETVPFPTEAGTVYGGTLVKNADGSGTLTASWAMLTANGTETYWQRGQTQNSYYYGLHTRKHAFNTIFACSHAKMISDATEYRNTEWSAFTGEANNGIPAYIHPSDDIQTVDAFKAFLAEQNANGTPVQWVYELATPVTYTIPAEDMAKLPTLKGANTVWMSADGSISLDYYADTKLYIDKLIGGIRGNIAYIEDGLTASRAYTAGQYVMVSGTLYKVQSNIASGATFTPGTNIIETTVGTELTAVNA